MFSEHLCKRKELEVCKLCIHDRPRVTRIPPFSWCDNELLSIDFHHSRVPEVCGSYSELEQEATLFDQ